jgi:hypothetical protein
MYRPVKFIILSQRKRYIQTAKKKTVVLCLLMMEAASTFETSVNFLPKYGATTYMTATFVFASMGT